MYHAVLEGKRSFAGFKSALVSKGIKTPRISDYLKLFLFKSALVSKGIKTWLSSLFFFSIIQISPGIKRD